MSDEAFDASLDLLRRLDPKNISKNLNNICRLQPDLSDDLLSSIDTPLKVLKCSYNGDKLFLCCDYNRDGDLYRSPWSNKYIGDNTADDDAPYPSSHLRQLEIYANESFDIYRDLYYEGGISSVYLWDGDDDDEQIVNKSGDVEFSGVALFKKQINKSLDDLNNGSWDSIHVFEINPLNGSGAGSGEKFAEYKLTSTVILDLSTIENNDDISLSGNLTKQINKKIAYIDSMTHISNIGSIIENMESNLRNMLQEIYFSKTKDIIGDLRTIEKLDVQNEDKLKHKELISSFQSL
ncbi:hypothetical protein CANARDRAFT_177178 [[Candida] arabinofermentans NRRL YB-2248]|uniref:F-actin-capping protein subunit beta n=1 Tax=[Candida] arabinofermentans NRRL YB-2248 TaxID=983967 RepID=A0A1E4SWW2_9ASCO|nr:hypothetical protein CANARDRAFT_177178 [[Candida] arabinofermentans NRRL YB-2248]